MLSKQRRESKERLMENKRATAYTSIRGYYKSYQKIGDITLIHPIFDYSKTEKENVYFVLIDGIGGFRYIRVNSGDVVLDIKTAYIHYQKSLALKESKEYIPTKELVYFAHVFAEKTFHVIGGGIGFTDNLHLFVLAEDDDQAKKKLTIHFNKSEIKLKSIELRIAFNQNPDKYLSLLK